jgi:hypothetical protein
MITDKNCRVIIKNDGAHILKHIGAVHPAAKLMVSMSAAQEVAAGEGIISVFLFVGVHLCACKALLRSKTSSIVILVTPLRSLWKHRSKSLMKCAFYLSLVIRFMSKNALAISKEITISKTESEDSDSFQTQCFR